MPPPLMSNRVDLHVLRICGEKLVTIKIFLLNYVFFFGGGGGRIRDKMALSAYILKIV